MDNFIKIEYPQIVNLWIDFSIDFDLLDKQNIALDDFWDEILEYIKNAYPR